MPKYDYKKLMDRNRKRYAKKVAGITLSASLALGVGAPAAANVLSDDAFQKTFGVSVAHAESSDLMGQDVSPYFYPLYNEEYGVTNYNFNSDLEIGTEINLDDYSSLAYIVKLPDELSYVFDDPAFENGLTGGQYNSGNFMMTGGFVDENGEEGAINSNDHTPADYVTINRETNSIEFNLYGFLEDNQITNLRNFDFNVPIFQEGNFPIALGDYTFQSALVAEGSGVDLNNISGAKESVLSPEEGPEGEDNTDGEDGSDEGEDNTDGEDGSDEGEDNTDGEDGSDEGEDNTDGEDGSDEGEDNTDGGDGSGEGEDNTDGEDGSDEGEDNTDGEDGSDEGEDNTDGEDGSDEGEDNTDGEDGSDEGEDNTDGEDGSGEGEDNTDGEDGSDEGEDNTDGEDGSDEGEDNTDGEDGSDEGEDNTDGEDGSGEGEDNTDGEDGSDEGEDNTGGEDGSDEGEDNTGGEDGSNEKDDNTSKKEDSEDSSTTITGGDSNDDGNSYQKDAEQNGVEKAEQGGELPNTSTNNFDMVLLGGLVALSGGLLLLVPKFYRKFKS
ncbi:LPXTG cell wall anchor domain-containing protein [Oceanobacillus locisalsi]|uniref:LPXTG cell wall anchor domain-containing protein n=1 Tax=Oceanobacillus locisalsi TaxID=546107 RepID=A0ABW3NMB4_9BACI